METTQLPDARWRARFRRRLLRWFGKHARDLPWRNSPSAYAVWVSEIMLQQTQVETVKSYFTRFLAELPDVYALARADEQAVLRLWEGLGYYRRARQMHRAARIIVDEYGGCFPDDAATLQTLPGVGRYTAGAIASIAFDRPAPILEANTTRLLTRLLAYREDPAASKGQRTLWSFAEQLLPKKTAGRFNQAVMELGALVCTPKSPGCDACPVMPLCPTFARQLQDEIPLAKRKMQYEDMHEAAVIVQRRGKVLLRLCGDRERWAGLWDFPRVSIEASENDQRRSEIADKVQRQTGMAVEVGELLATLKHGVTRYRITLSCYAAALSQTGGNGAHSRRLRWARPADLAELPLCTTGRKLAALVISCS